jgi:hypothetical protein
LVRSRNILYSPLFLPLVARKKTGVFLVAQLSIAMQQKIASAAETCEAEAISVLILFNTYEVLYNTVVHYCASNK